MVVPAHLHSASVSKPNASKAFFSFLPCCLFAKEKQLHPLYMNELLYLLICYLLLFYYYYYYLLTITALSKA